MLYSDMLAKIRYIFISFYILGINPRVLGFQYKLPCYELHPKFIRLGTPE